MSDSQNAVQSDPPPKERGKKRKKAPQERNPKRYKSIVMQHAQWTQLEKNQLLKALKECPCEEEIETVYTKIPTRSCEDVANEVMKLRNSVVQQGPDMRAPIESWLDMVEEMVHFEGEDHSKGLGRAMSMVANYKQFQTLPSPAPNYKRLYKYIAAILNGEEPPKLSPLDSVVVLDLMHSLADVLSAVNTQIPRRVMQWKYSMLNCKVDINNLSDTAIRVRRALSNEFPEEFRLTPAGLPQRTPSTSTAGTSHNATQTVTAASDTDDQNTPTNNDPTERPSTSQGGDNSGLASDNVVKERIQGEPTEDEPPKRRGRWGLKAKEPIMEKPLLYSLNPFCVPVGVLKLKEKKTKAKPTQ